MKKKFIFSLKTKINWLSLNKSNSQAPSSVGYHPSVPPSRQVAASSEQVQVVDTNCHQGGEDRSTNMLKIVVMEINYLSLWTSPSGRYRLLARWKGCNTGAGGYQRVWTVGNNSIHLFWWMFTSLYGHKFSHSWMSCSWFPCFLFQSSHF